LYLFVGKQSLFSTFTVVSSVEEKLGSSSLACSMPSWSSATLKSIPASQLSFGSTGTRTSFTASPGSNTTTPLVCTNETPAWPVDSFVVKATLERKLVSPMRKMSTTTSSWSSSA